MKRAIVAVLTACSLLLNGCEGDQSTPAGSVQVAGMTYDIHELTYREGTVVFFCPSSGHGRVAVFLPEEPAPAPTPIIVWPEVR